MRPGRLRALLIVATVGIAGSLVPAHALPGVTSLASVTSSEAQAGGSTPAAGVPDTTSPAVSLDGLTAAFSSDAHNLVSGDTNGVADVFIRNLATGKTARVSVSSSERQANGPSYSPALDVYGKKIAFVSEASNLVSGDTNGVADVFLRDLVAGTTKRISVSSSERQSNGASNTPFVSLFGRWVTFESAATNFDSSDDNGMPDAFIRDLKAGTTTRVVAPRLTQSDPKVADAVWTDHAQISFDGKVVSYVRVASRNVPYAQQQTVPDTSPPAVEPPSTDDLDLPADAPSVPSVPRAPAPLDTQPSPLDVEAIRAQHVPSALDLFVLERPSNVSTQVKVQSATAPVTGKTLKMMADHPVLSADGRFVAFESWDMIDGDDALVRDPTHYKTVQDYDRVSKGFINQSASSLGVAANGDSWHPSINAGGTIVAFVSAATNLVQGDTNGLADVFVHDAPARTTSRASISGTGGQANAASDLPTISYEGRRVFYASPATNLVKRDRNGHPDVFVRDRQTNTSNATPKIKELPGVRSINIGQEFRLQLTATDADHDLLRYGIAAVQAPAVGQFGPLFSNPTAVTWAHSTMPPGASLNAATGLFTWTPTPLQTGPWIFAFTVDDPRGATSYTTKGVKIVVRSASDSVSCQTVSDC